MRNKLTRGCSKSYKKLAIFLNFFVFLEFKRTKNKASRKETPKNLSFHCDVGVSDLDAFEIRRLPT